MTQYAKKKNHDNLKCQKRKKPKPQMINALGRGSSLKKEKPPYFQIYVKILVWPGSSREIQWTPQIWQDARNFWTVDFQYNETRRCLTAYCENLYFETLTLSGGTRGVSSLAQKLIKIFDKVGRKNQNQLNLERPDFGPHISILIRFFSS